MKWRMSQMIGNCFQQSMYEPYIRHCNEHNIKISTAMHVNIIYTTDKKFRENLIAWQKRFDDFSTCVRQKLIKLHLGLELIEKDLVEPEKSYEELTVLLNKSPYSEYLSQYKKDLSCILSIFQQATESL